MRLLSKSSVKTTSSRGSFTATQSNRNVIEALPSKHEHLLRLTRCPSLYLRLCVLFIWTATFLICATWYPVIILYLQCSQCPVIYCTKALGNASSFLCIPVYGKSDDKVLTSQAWQYILTSNAEFGSETEPRCLDLTRYDLMKYH